MSEETPHCGSEGKSLEDFQQFSHAPKNLSDEEIKALLSQDLRVDFNKISYALEDFHGVFYQLWDMGWPRLTFELPTAAVQFNHEGEQVDFMWNPIFWKKLDLYTKAFITAHECLHVVLNHGIRIKNCPIPRLANIGLDIVVNHMLVNKFGFNRASIDLSPLVEGVLDEDGKQVPHRNDRGDDIVLCWIDTVFGSRQGEVKRNKNFEYYYAMLEENIIIMPGAGGGLLIRLPGGKGGSERSGGRVLDEHRHLKGFGSKRAQDKIAERINDNCTDEEKEDFAKKVLKSDEGKAAEKASAQNETETDDTGGKQAGTIAGRIKYKANGYNVKKKRKWETVIKKWSRRWLKEEVYVEQWARKSRRFNDLLTDLIIPSDAEFDGKDEQRIDVVFYQDFSGSCFHLKDRFFRAAMSLPADRFNVILKCFDTEVHFVDPKDPNLTGGGGTSFSILEDDIQKMLKDGRITRYPDAVFLITDGYGDAVKPARPEKWYWFLSCDHRSCIPKESCVFMLEDYE